MSRVVSLSFPCLSLSPSPHIMATRSTDAAGQGVPDEASFVMVQLLAASGNVGEVLAWIDTTPSSPFANTSLAAQRAGWEAASGLVKEGVAPGCSPSRRCNPAQQVDAALGAGESGVLDVAMSALRTRDAGVVAPACACVAACLARRPDAAAPAAALGYLEELAALCRPAPGVGGGCVAASSAEACANVLRLVAALARGDAGRAAKAARLGLPALARSLARAHGASARRPLGESVREAAAAVLAATAQAEADDAARARAAADRAAAETAAAAEAIRRRRRLRLRLRRRWLRVRRLLLLLHKPEDSPQQPQRPGGKPKKRAARGAQAHAAPADADIGELMTAPPAAAAAVPGDDSVAAQMAAASLS